MPIDPGNRCTAGRSAQIATNASTSSAAIAATSKAPPIRRAITAGPLNAFSIGTCWSSTIPMSSALPLVVSRWSASASPVIHSSCGAARPVSLAMSPSCPPHLRGGIVGISAA